MKDRDQKREAAINYYHDSLTSDTRREEYRRRQEKRKRDYRKRIRSQNSSSYSSCLNTPQKEKWKLRSVVLEERS